jgi:zinc transport system substrate-binding protein
MEAFQSRFAWCAQAKTAQASRGSGQVCSFTVTETVSGFADRVRARMCPNPSGLASTLRVDVTDCRERTVVTSHAAFGYLAERYGLRQAPIAGLSPDAEPDAQTLAEIVKVARDAGVGTVFFEEALPPRLAETVAAAIGARVDLLAALEFDPGKAIGDGQDYLSVMRANGQRLHAGLGCR